jgi:ribosome assembly protein 1
MPVASQNLVRLQGQPELIRNICILAHVDHGKTSLSDCLLASNGIISQNMQGKIRYLDSRPDEQLRGITMESSAISLYFRVARKAQDQSESPVINEYLINLIDSPGHIDFASEVSTASRLCDGAVILVDVVEGVCSQTVTVLRQSWVEKLKPILVLNKMDRLITDLQLTPSEAYVHISKLIEQINAVVGSFYAGQRMEEDMKWRELVEQGTRSEFVDSTDEDIYFAPEKNNVVFGSAVDGWGFSISQFAAIYERKLGIKREKLEKVLWGDFYFDPKTKRVVPGSSSALKGRNYRPLFVQLVLENIWAIYDSTITTRNPDKITKIIDALDLKIMPRDITAKDGKGLLTSIFNQWIPMSRSILLSVIGIIPSPSTAQKDRMPTILESTPGHHDIPEKVRQDMRNCDRGGHLTAFISKVVAVPERDLPTKKASVEQTAEERLAELRNRSRKARELAMADGNNGDLSTQLDYLSVDESSSTNNDREVMIGFARVYSGTLRTGQEAYLLGPRYIPNFSEHCTKVTISNLYLLMGRELILIDEAPAGSIVGIGGLDGKILKSGTIVDIPIGGPNLAASNVTAPPILRVAVEPVDPTKIPELEKGLRLLNMSDPCVQVSVQENGEHILATAGELHLERCIKDLKERFAKVDIHYSKPVVPFRETIVEDASSKSDKVDDEDGVRSRGVVETTVGSVSLTFQVFPLRPEVSKYINEHGTTIRGMVENKSGRGGGVRDESREITSMPEEADEEVGVACEASELDVKCLERELGDLLAKERANVSTVQIVAFGPKKTGPNIMFDATNTMSKRIFSSPGIGRSPYEDNILTGFQLAMGKGPLCGEPTQAVGCILTKVEADEQFDANISRRIISATREAMHQAISDWSPRIMLATYLCDIQATTEVLGKVYGVITKRRGKIITEEMKEGTPFFTVHASVPVVEAFGFSDEVRKRTSGAANPQLVFSGFEMLDQDPFWVPSTADELEELGELAERENLALSYVVNVRKRKVRVFGKLERTTY